MWHDLTCGGKWSKYKGKHEGVQQYKCNKCGQLKNKKVSQTWCNHRFKLDRRHRPPILKCKKCDKPKPG